MKKTFRTHFFLMLVTLFTVNSYAQEIKFTNGTEYKDPSGTYISQLIGEEGNNTFVLRSGKKQFFIEKFSNNLSQVFSHEIIIPNATKKTHYNIQDVLLIDGKFYVFASNYDKKTDLNTFYAGYLKESGQITNFHEVSKIVSKSKRNSGSFNVSLSQDRSKICVQTNEKYDKKEAEKFSVQVFDLSFKTVWKKDVVLPIKDKNYSILKTVVDKDANIHLFASVYVPRKEREKGESSSYYQVFSYFQKDDIVKLYDIELDNHVISGIDIRLDDNNNLIGAGFYSERNGISMKGTFYFTINSQTRKIKSIAKKAFTKTFLAKFMSERKAQKGKELRNFLIRDIITKEDGGAVIVAEYYQYIRQTVKTSNGATRTIHRWYYNDLIVTNIGAKGQIDWSIKVPKRQSYAQNESMISLGSGGLSFFAGSFGFNGLKYLGIHTFVANDKIHIIFNEHPKNLEEGTKKVKTMSNARKSITTLVTISKTGTMKKTALFPAKDSKAIVVPRFSKKLDENTLLMYGDRGKTYHFIKLNFGKKDL